MRGQFITLEGGEGTGKTTQAKLLQENLAKLGVKSIVTREPGGTEEGEKIRNLLVQRDGGDWDPISEVLLLSAARLEHLKKKILPHLEAGTWVISDRFMDSSRVFQGHAMGVDKNVIETIYRIISNGFEPDLTFVFDIDPEIGLSRSRKQLQLSNIETETTEDRYERMGMAFHQKLRVGFQNILKEYPDRCHHVNAEKGILDIQKNLISIIQEKFPKFFVDQKLQSRNG